MTNTFNESLNNIRECMIKAGDFKIGNVAIKDADPLLLLPTEETLFEHWQVYQGAISYFGTLLNQSQNALKDAEDELQKVTLKSRGTLGELAKTKYGVSRPTKDDILIIGILEGVRGMEQLNKNVRYWQHAVRDLELWFKAWEKKSFILNGMTNAVLGDKNATMSNPRSNNQN